MLGERSNYDRAMSAFGRVEGYGERWAYASSPGPSMDLEDQAILAQQLSDLLCDMHHLADLADIEWDDMIRRGDMHYYDEIAEEADDA